MAQQAEIPSNARVAVYMRRRLREFQEKQKRDGGQFTNDLQIADAIGVHRSPFSRFMSGETNGADKIVPGLLRLLKITSYDDLHQKVRKDVPREPELEDPARQIEVNPRFHRLHVALEHALLSGIDPDAVRSVEQEALKSELDLTPEQWREKIMDAVRLRTFTRRSPAALARAAAQAEARARVQAEEARPKAKKR
jgi:hypothetical protein